jgi:uncharacterized membrane protein
MDQTYYILARALHVLAVLLWIGGVAFVTTVLIPALRKTQSPESRLDLFELLEGKFSFQAKLTTLLAGLSGFYMLHVLNAWDRLTWWLIIMIMVWGIFTLVLFVLEPLFLHKFFHKQAHKNSERTFFMLQLMHIVLLSISLLAVVAGVAGAHGLFY